jgi:hypothetical protein
MTRRKGVKHIFLKNVNYLVTRRRGPQTALQFYLGSSVEAAFTRPHPLVKSKKGRLAPARTNLCVLAN